MPLMKHTFIFQLARHGFTESWYRNAQAADPNPELAIARQYADARAPLLGAGAQMIAIRISNFDNKKQKALTVLENRFGNVQIGQNGQFLHPAAASNVALNMMATSANFEQEKVIQLRGIWDDFETQGGGFNPGDPIYIPLIQAWGAKVVQLGYGWRGSTSVFKIPFSGYTEAANHIVTFTFAEDFFTQAQVDARANLPVRISDCASSPNLNGPLVVFPVDKRTAQTIRPIATNPFVVGGKMQRNVVSFQAASGLRIQRIGNRQAGAPLLQSRGRGPVRVRG